MAESLESDDIHIAGLVVGDYCEDWNHWDGTHSLSQWMLDKGIPGICGMCCVILLLEQGYAVCVA